MKVNRRTQAERTAATRQALRKAARGLFAEHGFAAVSTQMIVDAAGVSRGALYHQFDDKVGLFAAVFDDVESEVIAATASAMSKADPDDPLGALVIGFDDFVAQLADPALNRIILIDAPAVLGWQEWRARGEQYGFSVVEAVLGQAVELGQLRRQPLRPLAHLVIGAVDELALYISRADDPVRARRETRDVIEQLISALATTP
ncbi:putative TetR family transcriptional regulator [Gordonia effusa NBRC 100432]|uniref:Putative TetR family transcriptional regulator n=1 Tax=Gordonia effusa NBRC 100432 TaxID=1077974 RepID=H0R4H8_9ACTN|nr:TetR/AcrR family transcriptional regulator [Gordonia effusa]GAB19979.1 putative TetR family transcriptional regulator [Gordonia effusa NBRC 100432]